jgi:4-diphosphocytidyl-2-C-methyl-D-erythritol kinase
MIFRSNVKVNIGLKVIGIRSDGYHNISTIFQELDCGDILKIHNKNTGFELSSNLDSVPLNKKNTCYRAYRIIKDLFPSAIKGLSVHIAKQIPPGTGLGAGSSNGATLLKAIKKIYNLNISNTELEKLSSQFSADAPFFINGKTQKGSGKGDVLENISRPFEGKFLMVLPNFSISTKWAFDKLKNQLKKIDNDNSFESVFYTKKSINSVKFFENDFERIVIPTYPEIGKIKTGLTEFGAIFSSLSGTGSTVFGVFNDETSAKEAELFFRNKYQTYLTNPI